jgi:hypothetical protein
MKNSLRIFLVTAITILSVAAIARATTIGTNVDTSGNLTVSGTTSLASSTVNGLGLFQNNVVIDNSDTSSESDLRVGDYGVVGALIRIQATTSRLMFISGEQSWPTTWSLGINTGVEASPNQDFQIREVSDGTSSVDLARLTILKSNGNVGIGTTTPGYKLDVNGDMHLGNGGKLRYDNWELIEADDIFGMNFWTAGQRRVSIDMSGNVGIGTTSTNKRLGVDSSNDFGSVLMSGSYPGIIFSSSHESATPDFRKWSMIAATDGFKMFSMSDADTNGGLLIYELISNSLGPLTNFTSGNVAVQGRLGIGTSTPEAKLQVYGGDTATSTIQIGGAAASSTKGACLKLRDSDGAGWTYCTTLNGTMNCSTTSCE